MIEEEINYQEFLTRTYVASRVSSRLVPSKDVDIVSPASESTRRTFPHSSTTAAFKWRLIVPTGF